MKRLCTILLGFLLLVLGNIAPVKADASANVTMDEQNTSGVHTISVVINPNGTKVCSMLSRYSFDKAQLIIKSIETGNSAFQNLNSEFYSLSTINDSSTITANLNFPGCLTGNFTAFRFTAISTEMKGMNTITANELSLMGGQDSTQAVTLVSDNPSVSFATTNDPSVDLSSLSQNNSSESNNIASSQSAQANSGNSGGVSSNKENKISQPTLISVIYSNSALLDQSKKRAKGLTFAGVADPDSVITVSIDEQPQTDLITADKSGNWSFTSQLWLNDGNHNFSIQAELAGQKSLVSRGTFYFDSSNKDNIGVGSEPKPVLNLKKMATRINGKWLEGLYGLVGLLIIAALGYGIYRYLDKVRIVENIPLNEKPKPESKEEVKKKPQEKQESVLRQELELIQNNQKKRFMDISPRSNKK